jgi:hypothetical protein
MLLRHHMGFYTDCKFLILRQLRHCFRSGYPRIQLSKNLWTRTNRRAHRYHEALGIAARRHGAYLSTSPGAPRGGDDRARTDDPLLAKQVLSQLSYIPLSPRGVAPIHKPSGGGPEWS